jgi:PKD repeat protein
VYAQAGQNGFGYTGMAKTLPADGTDPSVAAVPIQNTDGFGFVGGLGVTESGQAVLIWAKQVSAQFQAVASFRPAGGAFGPPVAISPDGQPIQSLISGATPSGDALVLYSLGGASPPHTMHARAFDATPPVLSGISIPSSADLGAAVPFAAQATDTWDPFTIGWNFGDGTGDGTSPSHTFGVPGPQNVTVTATDSAGNAASQSGMVTVNAPVVNPGPRTATAPVLSQLTLTNALFRVGKNPTATTAAMKRRKKIPTGTTFIYRLSDAATVTIAIARQMPGRKSGKRCIATTKKRVKAKAKKCTRYVAEGKLTRTGVPGANRIPFSGRIGKRALPPGSYRARLTPKRDTLAGAAKDVRFKIVR